MSFVQNFPFFNIILCLICAVTTFATGERWGRRLTVSLLSLSAALNGAVLWYCAANHCSYSYMQFQPLHKCLGCGRPEQHRHRHRSCGAGHGNRLYHLW